MPDHEKVSKYTVIFGIRPPPAPHFPGMPVDAQREETPLQLRPIWTGQGLPKRTDERLEFFSDIPKI